MDTLTTPVTNSGLRKWSKPALITFLFFLAAGWTGLYVLNENLWGIVLGNWFGLDLESRVGGSIEFFIYDSLKILLLLAGMIFAIGLLRTALDPDKIRSFLEGKSLIVALLLAAALGAVTPFCSCSSIPLFIGFVAAGVPIAVTLTFLIASPLMNEVAVVMLLQSFGWEVTVGYLVAGFTIAILAGLAFSRFNLTNQVEEFVFRSPVSQLEEGETKLSLAGRISFAWEDTKEIFGRVWKWVILGVAIGAVIHGWIPTEFFATYAGPDNPFAVFLAVVIGVPLYFNAAGVIPIAAELWDKGMALGTVMSFMMATVALSLPEFILLKRVLKPKLLFAFFGVVATGIIVVGLIFNFAMA